MARGDVSPVGCCGVIYETTPVFDPRWEIIDVVITSLAFARILLSIAKYFERF